LAEILSIATAVPAFCHAQKDILSFMQHSYGLDETDKRKLGFLYKQSEIQNRHSVIGDYTDNGQPRTFVPGQHGEAFPNIDSRMELYEKEALPLAISAIEKVINGFISISEITHLITVSCTGMSAPGLDLQIMESLQMAPDIVRTSVNFMGCYAAIHGLKMAKLICDTTPGANVIIVAVELCTIHFQKDFTPDNAASSLLFADGAAAVLVSNKKTTNSLSLKKFYAYVDFKGKQDMSWSISNTGFLMTLSGYVPQLIQADIASLVQNALAANDITIDDITHWCIHPGGKKILEVVQKQMQLCDCSMMYAKKVLSEYGNMSSPTVLFVLKEIMTALEDESVKPVNIFGVAFGPGLTMETFIAGRG